jgi:outer membrane protein
MVQQYDFNGAMELAMPLVDLQAWYNIKVSKQAVNLIGLKVEEVRQQVLLNVAEAYFSALMAARLIDIKMSSLAAFDHHLTVSEARLKVGQGLRIDVIRAQTDIDTTKQQLIAAHLAYDNARDALCILTRAEKFPEPVMTDKIAFPDGSEDELVEKARVQRRDLKRLDATISLEEKQLRAAYMQFLPSLSALGKGTYQITDPAALGSSDKSRGFALFTMTLPIFNYHRYGDIDMRKSAIRKAEIEKEDVLLKSAMKVRKARRDYFAALASVEIAERQAILSREALSLTEAAFYAGTGTSLDVTDARRNVLQSDVDTVTKDLKAQMSLLRLLFEIGEDMSLLGK